jgi:hypothetical protein
MDWIAAPASSRIACRAWRNTSGSIPDVARQGVQVIAAPGNVGAAVTATVERDAAQPGVHQPRDLAVPHGLAAPETVDQENRPGVRVPQSVKCA